MARTNYSPLSTDSLDDLATKAFNCGRDLDPEDARANWIEDYTGEEHRQLVESYHAGQAEQYENEDW